MKIIQIKETEKVPFYVLFLFILMLSYAILTATRVITIRVLAYILYGIVILNIFTLIKLIYLNFCQSKKKFVCEIQIDNSALCFVYVIQNLKSSYTFNYSDIMSGDMNINTNYDINFLSQNLIAINFEIKTVRGNHQILLQPQTHYDAFNIIYSILDISQSIPNFTYEIFGKNKKNTEEALKYHIDTK